MNPYLSLSALLLATQLATAQDFHYNPVGVSPTTINPSYTGMFHGDVRISGMYQLLYSSSNPRPYETMTIGADLPVYTDSNGNYFAAGLQAVSAVVPVYEHDYRNSEGLVSLAYHRNFGRKHNYEVAMGVQGGYMHKRKDMSDLYFGRPVYQGFKPIVWPNTYGVRDVQRYNVNAGISFSQRVDSKLSYTVGFSGNNLNQPRDNNKRQDVNALGLGESIALSAGASWDICRRITLRPAGYIQINDRYRSIAGTDVQINFGSDTRRTFFSHLFAGAWYHGYRQAAFTLGTEFRGFRLALASDTQFGFHTSADSNLGCYALQLQYIASSGDNIRTRRVICDRF